MISLLRPGFPAVFSEYPRCSVRSRYSTWLELSNFQLSTSFWKCSVCSSSLLVLPPKLFFVQTHRAYACFLVFSQILMRTLVKLSIGLSLCGSLLTDSLWQIPVASASPGLCLLNSARLLRSACFPSLGCGLECASKQKVGGNLGITSFVSVLSANV